MKMSALRWVPHEFFLPNFPDIEELPLGSTSGVANSSNVDGVASLVERLREAEIRAKLAEEELARVTEDFNHLRCDRWWPRLESSSLCTLLKWYIFLSSDPLLRT